MYLPIYPSRSLSHSLSNCNAILDITVEGVPMEPMWWQRMVVWPTEEVEVVLPTNTEARNIPIPCRMCRSTKATLVSSKGKGATVFESRNNCTIINSSERSGSVRPGLHVTTLCVPTAFPEQWRELTRRTRGRWSRRTRGQCKEHVNYGQPLYQGHAYANHIGQQQPEWRRKGRERGSAIVSWFNI